MDQLTKQLVAIDVEAVPPLEPHEFEVVGPEDAVRVRFDDLDLKKLVPDVKSEEEAATRLPDWIKALNGRRIRIRGFMEPPFMAEGLTQFLIARDVYTTGWRQNPMISELVDVTLRDGVTTDYIHNRAFDVVGLLRITDEAKPGRFYQLTNAIVINSPQR